MRRIDDGRLRTDHPLQDVAKLSNIPRPVILEKGLSRIARQTSGWPPEGPADPQQKHLAQRHDDATLAQRRNLDVEDAEAVEQVGAKVAALNGFAKVAVRRGGDPDVRLQEARAAEPLELAFLQNAQELACADRFISVTSSRNSTPPEAISSCPGFLAARS